MVKRKVSKKAKKVRMTPNQKLQARIKELEDYRQQFLNKWRPLADSPFRPGLAGYAGVMTGRWSSRDDDPTYFRNTKWKDWTATPHLLRDMSDRYIANCMAFLHRRIFKLHELSEYNENVAESKIKWCRTKINAMVQELAYRIEHGIMIDEENNTENLPF